MELAVVSAVALGALVTLPHLLPLRSVAPTSAAAVWFLALCLRALAAVAVAIYMLAYLPQTARFAGFADWCLHLVVPIASIHLHVAGMRLAHGIAVLPVLVLVVSLVWVGVGFLRARLYADRLLRGLPVATGPLGSTVVASEEVLLAVTQVGPPRLIVSGATLTALDEDELQAGLQHELGHLRRPHRPVLLAASVLQAMSRWQPGAGSAFRELCFSLERDADEYALEQTRDPLALASAICKAALSQGGRIAVMGLQGHSGVALRLEQLLAGGRQRAGAGVERGARLLALAMLALLLLLAVAAPAWAVTRPGSLPHIPGTSGWSC